MLYKHNMHIISNLDTIGLISQTDTVIVTITNSVSATSIADDITVKNNVSLKISTNIIIRITPVGLVVILMIMSLSTLITTNILYFYY